SKSCPLTPLLFSSHKSWLNLSPYLYTCCVPTILTFALSTSFTTDKSGLSLFFNPKFIPSSNVLPISVIPFSLISSALIISDKYPDCPTDVYALYVVDEVIYLSATPFTG